jgi:acyl-coenzyme A thioesterase PaaI-like protein
LPKYAIDSNWMLLRKIESMDMTASKLKRRLGVYAPYLGAGVRVTHIADDFLTVHVEMPLRFYNRNYVGTHFGGSLYSMCDPFYMLMLINILGPDYIVWDKSAAIRFKRPGKGTVKAVFEIPAERVAEIKAAADSMGKVEPQFQVLVMDEEGQIVAEIDKLLYVRRKMQDKKSQ